MSFRCHQVERTKETVTVETVFNNILIEIQIQFGKGNLTTMATKGSIVVLEFYMERKKMKVRHLIYCCKGVDTKMRNIDSH